MAELNDQQKQIVRAIDGNVHVAAGAGTGKTETLKERYFHILEDKIAESGFGLENILAITFTKAAAQEMRTRIRDKIGKALNSVEKQDSRNRLADFLAHFDRAQIMTIDALQGKILREHPVEAGINPDYQVLQGVDYDNEIVVLTETYLRTHVEDEDLVALLQDYDLKVIRENLVELYKKDKPQLEKISMETLLWEQPEVEKLRAEHWLKFYHKLAEYLRKKKDSRDIVGFGDVARRAVALLKSNDEVRHRYQKQYQYIMVDEFQDTNAAQQELVYLLCGDSSTEKVTLTGQKLFIVGDEKQSIYRFRGAEVEVFHEVCQQMDEQGGTHVDLMTNYRSTKQVIDFVNEIFGETGLKLENYQPLEYPEEKKDQQASLPLIKSYCRGGRQNNGIELPIEAADVAKYIKDLPEEARNKEIAILLPVTTNIGYLTKALQAVGIDYVVLGGHGFYETQEVLDVLNIFRVLHNPQDNLALLGVLRSPYCGCNDQELTDFCRANFNVTLTKALQESGQVFSEQLQRAAKILAKLKQAAQYLPVVELWQEVFRTFNVEYILRSQEQGEQKWANVLKLQILCWNYCNRCNCGLQEWLTFVEDAVEENKETAADLPATNAVKIMTIHKSKGLAFDTVILPFLDKSGGQSDKLQVVFNQKEREFGAKLPWESKSNKNLTQTFKKLNEHQEAAELAEEKRKLYVALTRAKERLYLSGWQKTAEEKPGDSNFWTMVQYGKEKADWQQGVVAQPEKTQYSPKERSLKVKQARSMDVVLPLVQYFSPSRLQTYLYCQRRYFYQYGCGLPPYLPELEHQEGQAGLAPAEQGILLHKALEYHRRNGDAAFAKAVQFCQLQNYDMSDAEKLFAEYIKSDIYRAIPEDHRRELEFQLPLDDGVVFGGVIDCLYKKADGTYGIVDYKTGRVLEQLDLGYSLQLAIYAQAVEKMFKGTVSELQLHYLQDCQKFSVERAGDVYAEALQLAREIQSKRQEVEFTPNCAHCAHCEYAYLCSGVKI